MRCCKPLANTQNWNNTPFRPLSAVYSQHSQLPFVLEAISFIRSLRKKGRNALLVVPEESHGVKTQENKGSADSLCIVRRRKMCAQSDKQTLKRNTPEISEHVDIPFRRTCHVARTMAATVKGFQELSTCKTNGHKGADRGIMELEMEKLIGKKQEEMNVANGGKVFLSRAFTTLVARMQRKRKVH